MIPEEALRLAAQRAGQTLTDSLPDPETCDHEFSPAFEKKMKRLINREQYAGVYRGLKRVACFFLAVLLSGSVWLSVDAEARQIVFGWLSEKTEDAQRYFFGGGKIDEEDIVHYQIDVPEGYWLESRYENGGHVDEYYVNGEGKSINFIYIYEVENSSVEMYVGNMDSKQETAFVHDIPADLYIGLSPEDSNTVVWMDTTSGALFDVTADMGVEELIDLAESVEPREK